MNVGRVDGDMQVVCLTDCRCPWESLAFVVRLARLPFVAAAAAEGAIAAGVVLERDLD